MSRESSEQSRVSAFLTDDVNHWLNPATLKKLRPALDNSEMNIQD